MCGEQDAGGKKGARLSGSPPRVRGTAPRPPQPYTWPWITPACAGNRRARRPNRPCSKDHPRVCGEQRLEDTERGCDGGSPPRVRGTGLDLYSPVDVMRITPACAGNSKTCISLRISSRDHPCVCGEQPVSAYMHHHQDHPRVCGEQQEKASAPASARGSPPRVRGTVDHDAAQVHGVRITPACAGNRRGDTATRTQY